MEEQTQEQWAIVELMGHRVIAGRVSKDDSFGVVLTRVDIPREGSFVSQFYGGAAIYCITPCDEATARKRAEPPARPYAYIGASAEQLASPTLVELYAWYLPIPIREWATLLREAAP